MASACGSRDSGKQSKSGEVMARDEQADVKVYIAQPVRRFYASGPEPMESNQVIEDHGCIGGCGRTPCLASKPGFTFFCCPSCPDGLHTPMCDSEWEHKRFREIFAAPSLVGLEVTAMAAADAQVDYNSFYRGTIREQVESDFYVLDVRLFRPEGESWRGYDGLNPLLVRVAVPYFQYVDTWPPREGEKNVH